MGGSINALSRRAFRSLDRASCSLSLALVGDRPGLLSLLFHSLSEPGEGAAIDRLVEPSQTVSTEALADCIEYFLSAGYTFLAPKELLGDLDDSGRYMLLTFDDGYHNNFRALPVLERYQVPATFFISTNHVAEGWGYWWDVLYRERSSRGGAGAELVREREWLKAKRHNDIVDYLTREFGAACLRPVADEDRPMTGMELNRFAREPFVHIGNHTCDHAILTNYKPEEVQFQICEAQDSLERMTGNRPIIISYPNGNWSPEVVEIGLRSGLRLGVTYDDRRGRLPRTERERLTISRFGLVRGQADHETYRRCRSSFSIRRALRPLLSAIR